MFERVRALARFYLPLLFLLFTSASHRRYFVGQWGACGVAASLVGDSLVFHV